MYYVSKTFKVPMAHRLSKNTRACQFLHGHNLDVKITVKSNKLNENDMVIDFYDLKSIVEESIKDWDHGLFLNSNDEESTKEISSRKHLFLTDPTSEILSYMLYNKIKDKLPEDVSIYSVSVSESEGSEAMYSE